MVAGLRTLEIQGRTSPERKQLEELRPVHLVCVDAERRAGRIVQVPLQISREKQLGKSQCAADSELPAVHQCRLASDTPFAGLPLIRAFQLHAKRLPAPKYIFPLHAEDCSGTCLVIALCRHIKLQFAIQRQIKSRIDPQVQRVAPSACVARRKLHLAVFEYSQTSQIRLCQLLFCAGITVSPPERDFPVQDGRTHLQLVMVEDFNAIVI